MGFAEKEQARKTKSVVSAIAGVEGPTIAKGRPKTNRETKERKSISILPSIYEDAGKIAYIDRESVSEIISKCLKKYIEDNQEKIKEYNRLKK